MDFSDIVQPPNQPKQYSDVLDDYGRAAAQEPEIAKMSVPDFSQRMNDMFGTHDYDEGTHDNWLRRMGVAPERVMRHFGGQVPGSPILSAISGGSALAPLGPVAPALGEMTATGKVPTPSEMFGGPKEGIDLIKGAGTLAQKGATALGAPEGLAGAIGKGAEGFVKTAPAVAGAIAFPEAAIPILGGSSALETYGETGKALPAAVSGITAAAIPKVMESAGQGALRFLGAKTVGELRPELRALAEGGSEAAKDVIPKFAPSNLAQRVGRFGAAQAGMFGASEVGGVGQTLVDPSLTWQEKGHAIAQQFQPSNLVGSAIAQLPFTAMDVLSERTHPLTQAENIVKGDFTNRFVSQAVKGDPETNSPGFIPTQADVAQAMDAVATGKKPDERVGTILKSMSTQDLFEPVITKDEQVPMAQMQGLVRVRAQEILYARGHDDVLNEGSAQTISQIVRSVEKTTEKDPLSKEDMTNQVAQAFVNRFEADKLKQQSVGTGATGPVESPTGETASLLRHEQRMRDITRAISPTIEDESGQKVDNPDYDKEAHQRVALTTGTPQDWEDLGMTNAPIYNRGIGTELADARVGEWTGKVNRAATSPTQMSANIMDMMTGRSARIDPRVAQEELDQHQADLADIDGRIDQLLESLPEVRSTWTDRQARSFNDLASERQYLKDEVARIKQEMGATKYPSGGRKQVKGEGKFLNEARASQEAVIRAFEYGTTPGDKAKGTTLDVNDPVSVSKFIRAVQYAAELGGVAANRQRGAEELLPTEHDTLAAANRAIVELRKEAKAAQDRGEVPTSYYLEKVKDEKGKTTKEYKTYQSSTDPNKQVYRIMAQKYTPMTPILERPKPGEYEEGTGEAGLEAREEGVLPTAEPSLAELGFDSGKLTDNIYTKRFTELRGMTDRAEAEARSYALANNIAYFLTRMPDAEMERLLLDEFAKKYTGATQTGLRNLDVTKMRIIRYAQYLRDGGTLQLALNKNDRITAPDEKQLAAFDRYMSVVGLGAAKYKDTDKVVTRRGTPHLEYWNSSTGGHSKAGLNFFEQFSVLMDTLRDYMVDPSGYRDIVEAMPRGDFITIPPKFRNEATGKLIINWGPEFEARGKGTGGQFALTPEALAAYPEAKGVRLDIKDREGNPVALVSGRNPLIEFFKRSPQQELLMPLNQMLDLFRQYGKLNPENTTLLNFAQRISNLSPFVRDMNVGAAIAKDPQYKAYYHSDDVASSAGILLSPYEYHNMFDAGGTYVRAMMKPDDFFPHFMNEIGHAAADFGYLNNGTIRAEVDRMWKHVKDLVDKSKNDTSELGEYSKNPLHALDDPREFLAGMFNDVRLHQLLQKIDVPFDWEPLPGAPVAPNYVGTLFNRILTFLRNTFVNLFGVGQDEANTMLNRMAAVTARAVDAQMEMNLYHRGDIYQQATVHGIQTLGGAPTQRLGPQEPMRSLKVGGEGVPQFPRQAPPLQPVEVKYLADQLTRSREEYAEHPSQITFDNLRNATQMWKEAMKGLQPPYTWMIRNQESAVADAKFMVDWAQQNSDLPNSAKWTQLLQQRLVVEQQKLNALYERQASEGGTMLASRLVPEESDLTDIEKPVFNIQGRKGTLLRDPVVNNIVTSFTAGANVKDAFSGSGQLSTFAKNAGANSVSLNVFRPEMHAIFDEIKNNPIGFGRRVANVTRQIDAKRETPPKMRNGSDLRTFLDGVEARDPTVGLFVKQNLSYFGREVGTEGKFTPKSQITNQGMTELPARIRRLSNSVDEVTQGNGWDVVANAKPGDRVMVDPPYIQEKNRYGAGQISPEQRLTEYEQYMFPAARRGARFLVFDLADPRLMQSLVDHGFTVQPVQRSTTRAAVPKQEFVAYNHTQGSMMPSKVYPQAALDSMSAAATIAHEADDKVWFKPYDLKYFRDTYGPMLGGNMALNVRANELGYVVPRIAFNGLTHMDIAKMPVPHVPTWAPSLYETMRNLAANQGSSPETANALATQMLQFGSLWKNTERTYYGTLPTTKSQHKDAGNIAGRAWGWSKVIGLTPESITQRGGPAKTIRHESSHTSGAATDYPNPDTLTPDVKAATDTLNSWFDHLDEDGRADFLKTMGQITLEDVNNPWYYKAATRLNYEFAAEWMGHMGEMLAQVPDPSAYLKDHMRFTTDDVSNLLKTWTLRRQQGLNLLVDLLNQRSRARNENIDWWGDMVKELSDSFKPLSRSALNISTDISEFFRMRMLYPDMYTQLLNNLSTSLSNWGDRQQAIQPQFGTPTLPTGTPPGTILASKDGIVNTIRRWAKFPDTDGNLPDKLGWWDKWLTNFPQFAQKYPIARSAWDMFYNARALYSAFRAKTNAALGGPLVGDKTNDDLRTKQIHDFQRRLDLRDVFSKIALDLNEKGDTAYDKEYAAKAQDVMAMNPDAVTGWLTPEYMSGLLKKYGVADKDIPTMMTVLDGTRNQIREAALTITESAIHRLSTTVSVGVARNTDLPPEAARKAAQLMMDAVKLQDTDPLQSEAKLLQFQQTLNNDATFNRLYELASAGWDGVLRLQQFLALRMPYYMSERRPGQYGYFYRDADGKITSRYYRNEADLRKAITEKGIEPVRTTFPSDRDYGVSPTVFKQLDEVQARLNEKLTNLFGTELGPELAGAMDLAGDLREALNSRDVLKITTGRDLAPGREELDMFSAHQQYMNAVGRASYNSFIRLESELLNTAADFRNQPAIKKYINDQVKMVLSPDSPLGRQAQNLAFLYYLWGNPSSMIMQSSHQLLGLAPMLTERGQSVANSYKLIGKANLLFMESRRNKGVYKDPEIQEAVERARRDGSIGSWLARDMDYGQDLSIVNRLRATSGKGMWSTFDLLKNKLYQGFDLLRKFYDIVPTYNSEVALVSSLLHYKSEAGGRLSGDDLFKEAQFLRANTMFTGGKEARPGFFQYLPRSAAQSLWSLQTYANGLTTMMGELIRKGINPKGAGLSPAQGKQVRYAAAQMLTTQVAVAGVLGLPFAQAILYGLQKMFPEHDLESDLRDALASLAGDDEHMGNILSSYVTAGIPSSLDYSPDLGARFALAGTFHVSPYSGVDWGQLVGPSGGIIERALSASQAAVHGDPMGTVQQLMPNGFQRIFTALQQQNEYRTQSGKLVVNDLRPEEIVARALGFRPSRVARGEDFGRLSRMSEDAEKAEQTAWTKQQVQLLGSGQDETVQRNIAQRATDKGGVYSPVQLSNDISREYERATMPVDYRNYGNRSTVREQRNLRAVLGTQSETPGNLERLQLQQNIAQRLGLGGPSRSSLRRAGRVDQLIQMYPHLTNAQANLLLSHAAASRPTPDLYRELLEEY